MTNIIEVDARTVHESPEGNETFQNAAEVDGRALTIRITHLSEQKAKDIAEVLHNDERIKKYGTESEVRRLLVTLLDTETDIESPTTFN